MGEIESKRDTTRERLFTELLERRPLSSEIQAVVFQAASIASPREQQALELELLQPQPALVPALELPLASEAACQFAAQNHQLEHEQYSRCFPIR